MAQALQSKTVVPRAPSLPGFESVQRFWDPSTDSWTAKILPGEFYVTQAGEAVTTVLGSCIAACVRDTELAALAQKQALLPQLDNAARVVQMQRAYGAARTVR